MNQKISLPEKSKTGIPGLDEILGGGLPKDQLYLIQGKPGTGKTTLALQYLLEGAQKGEGGLYITFSETKFEIETVADSHGWDLSKISILELTNLASGGLDQTTLFHPSEVELAKTIKTLMEKIVASKASRVVFDSVSELRLLAETSLRYRRQMLAFKEFFVGKGSTVLFLDDLTTEGGDVHVQSIVHGVLLLEKLRASYGVERRQFHIVKLRGVNFRGGTHDYLIERGGLRLFPRLVGDGEVKAFKRRTMSSGIKELDQLLGGGLDCGTSNLIMGPAGTGKSTIAAKFACSAADRGEKVVLYSFEENPINLLARCNALGLNLEEHLKSGQITLRKVDPAELTPGQFASLLKNNSTEEKAEMVVIDSLNGYIHAMPEQQFLMLQLHEILSFLGNRGVVTLMILSQAGIMGAMQTPLDLTYLADSVIVTRFFEAFGSVKKSISVIKKRTGAHEETLRELRVGKGGVAVGPVLEKFHGVFSGVPKFIGDTQEILKRDDE